MGLHVFWTVRSVFGVECWAYNAAMEQHTWDTGSIKSLSRLFLLPFIYTHKSQLAFPFHQPVFNS
jgi:hypothetical protein